jgi:lipoprotein Spr
MIQKTIRRFGSVVSLIAFALLISAATTTDSVARTHKTGRIGSHGKSTHNARHSGKHSARLSHRMNNHPHASSKPLTSAEKEQIVEKIKELAKSSLVSDTLVPQSEIESQIAQAAKEEQAEDDVDVSIEQFFKARPGAIGSELSPDVARERQQDFTLFDESDPNRAAQRSDIMAEIIDWIGTRYIFGGQSRTGIDCSAFTRQVFERAFGLELPRTAYMQSQLGDQVAKPELQFGDLVFFKTARYAPITHVGIYIGEGLFANAACSRGVTVASLSSTYWTKRYVGARRLFSNSTLAAAKSKQTALPMAAN